MEGEKIQKLSAKRAASSARLHEFVAVLRKIIRGCDEKKDRAADMLVKAKKLYEKARSKVTNFRAVKVSKLQEKSHKLTDKVETNHLEHKTMPGHVVQTIMLREKSARV